MLLLTSTVFRSAGRVAFGAIGVSSNTFRPLFHAIRARMVADMFLESRSFRPCRLRERSGTELPFRHDILTRYLIGLQTDHLTWLTHL